MKFLKYLVVLSVITAFALSYAPSAAAEDEPIASGECGSCHWVIDGNGTLTVSEGVLDEWEAAPPWSKYSGQIKKVMITENVVLKTGHGMFHECWSLKSVDLSGLDTSDVRDFGAMFYWCSHLTSLDLSQLDTSKAENMNAMFANCGARNLDFSGFDTSHVTDMGGMFSEYLGGTLDLTDLDFSSVTYLDGFLSYYLNELIIGDWIRYSLRPTFEVGMYDKETGEFFEAGEVVPAVTGHHFVRYKDHSHEYTITNVQLDKAKAEWGDWVTIQIDYIGKEAPESCEVIFWHSIFSRFRAGEIVDQYADAPFRVLISGNYSKGAGEAYYNKFDKATGKGTLSLKTRIGSDAMTGIYPGVTIDLCASEDRVSDDAEFYDIVPLEVCAPNYNSVIDEAFYWNGTGFFDALRGINEGEAAILRLEGGKNKIPQEYLEALRGKDIAILIPDGYSYIEINGKDITDDTEDVYLPSSSNVFSFGYGGNDNGEMTNYDFSMSFRFPNNGSLPTKLKVCIDYETEYRTIAGVFKRNLFQKYLFTEDQIDDMIKNSQYYVSDGVLVKDRSVEINGNWIEITVSHNSALLIMDSRNLKEIRSFDASVSKKEFTYNGKAQKPKAKVQVIGHWGKSDDYITSYSNKNSTSVGTYTITVKAKKVGYGTQTLKYKINPKGTTVSKLPAVHKGFKAVIKKNTTQTTGYQIRYSAKSSMSGAKIITIKSNKTTSRKVTGLKAKTKYYVQVRTYKTVNGTKYYSAWSEKKTVRTKK